MPRLISQAFGRRFRLPLTPYPADTCIGGAVLGSKDGAKEPFPPEIKPVGEGDHHLKNAFEVEPFAYGQ